MIDEKQCKKLRKQLKLSIYELSAAIGERESRIWLLEHGFSDHVDSEALERIKHKLQDLCEKKELDSMET